MQYQPRYMELYMDHVCTHVPHLDLFNIDQNMSATARLIVTSDPWKNLNQLTLQPCNLYILGNVPHFCTSNSFFSFWHNIPLDNYWIDHAYQFWPPNPCMRLAVAHQKKYTCSQFMRKPSITKILERYLLVGKKFLYKFLNDIASQLLTLSWSFENLRLHHIFLISEVISCPILMFQYSFQSLEPPLQESKIATRGL